MTPPPGGAAAAPRRRRRTGIARPDEFLPERWLESDPDYPALAGLYYHPFSAGRRNCVGQNLAMLELKMVLAPLVQRYTFELVDRDVRSEYFLTLKPHDCRVRVRPRASV